VHSSRTVHASNIGTLGPFGLGKAILMQVGHLPAHLNLYISGGGSFAAPDQSSISAEAEAYAGADTGDAGAGNPPPTEKEGCSTLPMISPRRVFNPNDDNPDDDRRHQAIIIPRVCC
jgi:hypothetical protein